MADETNPVTEAETHSPAVEEHKPEPVTSEPETAVARLRAFEDEHLGADAVRIRGTVERGSGSAFRRMSDKDRATHAALEKLVEAEQKLADAHGALMQADIDHEAAMEALAKAEQEANAKPAE